MTKTTKSRKKINSKSFTTRQVESIETKELENILLSSKTAKAKKLLNSNDNFINTEKANYNNYIKDLIYGRGLTIREALRFAGMKESYGRKVINGEKSSNRDNVLRVCISAGFTLKETNRVLKLNNMRSLYAKDKRDAVIMLAINDGVSSTYDVDDMLTDNELPILHKPHDDD